MNTKPIPPKGERLQAHKLPEAKPYSPPATIMAPERARPADTKATAHHDPIHLLARWKELRGGIIGLVTGLALGIMVTWLAFDRATQTQTAATASAVGAGVAIGAARADAEADQADYGDDFGHKKGGERYREPKGAK